jgi:hypothetical protein
VKKIGRERRGRRLSGTKRREDRKRREMKAD